MSKPHRAARRLSIDPSAAPPFTDPQASPSSLNNNVVAAQLAEEQSHVHGRELDANEAHSTHPTHPPLPVYPPHPTHAPLPIHPAQQGHVCSFMNSRLPPTYCLLFISSNSSNNMYRKQFEGIQSCLRFHPTPTSSSRTCAASIASQDTLGMEATDTCVKQWMSLLASASPSRRYVMYLKT